MQHYKVYTLCTCNIMISVMVGLKEQCLSTVLVKQDNDMTNGAHEFKDHTISDEKKFIGY